MGRFWTSDIGAAMTRAFDAGLVLLLLTILIYTSWTLVDMSAAADLSMNVPQDGARRPIHYR